MYRLAMDYEDFQSEAFCCYLKTLKYFENSNFENIKEYFVTNFKNKILNLFRDIERQVTGHGILSNMNKKDQERRFSYSIHSLQERNEEGNLKYDLPDTDAEKKYFQDYYPRIKKLLTEQELQVIVYHYVEGFSIKATSKKFGISSRTVDNIIKSTKEKLKALDK